MYSAKESGRHSPALQSSSSKQGKQTRSTRMQSAKTAEGNSTIERSIEIMKEINQTYGERAVQEADPTRTKYQHLSQLKTEPVLKFLKENTWRSRFDDEVSMKKRGSESQSIHGSQLFTELYSDVTTNETDRNLERIQNALNRRIESLWTELRISSADISYFHSSLAKQVEEDEKLKRCKLCAVYVQTLIDHRDLTLSVLKLIRKREKVLEYFFDVVARPLYAMTEFDFRRKRRNRGRDGRYGSGDEDDGDEDKYMHIFAWDQHFVETLRDIQQITMETVKAIQLWRKALWRPHAFNWKGDNYLLKIYWDLEILAEDPFRSQLEEIGIDASELHCLLFSKQEIAEDDPTKHGPSVTRHESVKVIKCPESLLLYDEDFEQSGKKDGDRRESDILRDKFLDCESETKFEELLLASKVVSEEWALAKALSIEKEALKQRGAFIPTLKLKSL